MSMMQSINKFFGIKPKAFIVDDEIGCCRMGCCRQEDLDIVKSLNVDVEQFKDFKSLLYKLQLNHNKYKVGIIHENETKYPSMMLSDFIKSIDPKIKMIIYKDSSQLKYEAEKMILT